jgi:hypothetical protein
MGNSIRKVNFWDDFIQVEFTDGNDKYSVTISKEEEKKDA